MSDKDSTLDGLMKGLGRQLGKRRRDVHKAIDRFKEEANREETPPSQAASALAATGDPETNLSNHPVDGASSQKENASHEAKA